MCESHFELLLSFQVHETRSRTLAASQEEGKAAPKKQKTESKEQEGGQQAPSKNKKTADNEEHDGEQEPSKNKKLKAEESDLNGKATAVKEFSEFCKAIREHLTIEDMRKILQGNEQDASGSEDAVVPRWYCLFKNVKLFFYQNIEFSLMVDSV